MGWTFMRDTSGKSPKEYLDGTLTWENEHVTARLLKSARVGSIYYAAVESVFKDGRDRCVWAAVFLTRSCKRAKDGYTFGYKDMTEEMGPVESKCPVGILDLLTETKHEYALNCRANAALKAAPAPAPGLVLRFKEPIYFTDKTTHSEFTVVTYSRKGRTRTAFRAANGGLYRISDIKTREFEIVH